MSQETTENWKWTCAILKPGMVFLTFAHMYICMELVSFQDYFYGKSASKELGRL